jgi:hypothetical protein
MRKNPTRQGFLILIMIAFASILLGLATTFFIYCTKALDSSSEAVRYAQSRIALHGALNYVYYQLNAAQDTYLLSDAIPGLVQLSFDVPGVGRAKKMGYARIALVTTAALTYEMQDLDGSPDLGVPPLPLPPGPPLDIEFNVTVGAGPWQGNTANSLTLVDVRRTYKLTANVMKCGTGYSNTAKSIKLTLGPLATSQPAIW